MTKRFQQFMSIILLLLLQVIGSVDLCMAMQSPLETRHTTLDKQQDFDIHSYHSAYRNIHIDFHKHSLESLEDEDRIKSHSVSLDKPAALLLIQFVCFSFGALLSKQKTRDPILALTPRTSTNKYILFSNFRI